MPVIPMPDRGDWSPDQFEQAGQAVLRMLRDHFAAIDEVPVASSIGAAELKGLLDGPVPEEPEDFEAVLADTRTKVIPHLTHWNHPNFFAYFATSASGPGILADTVISALNVNAMLWKTSPAASALEQVVLRWLAEMAGYDPGADGVLINGASLGTFYALAAAREATGLGIRERGMAGRDIPVLRVYCTEHAHSSIDKAVIALGIGLDNLVKIPADEHHRVQVDRLEDAIRDDVARGYRPMAVVAVAGTTSTGAVDPLAQVADVCRRYDLWLHVDAAYGGFYNLVPEVRAQVGDFTMADSIVINPHKVLFTPLEVTALYSRRRGRLAQAFSLVPEYLRTEPEEGTVNYMDFSLQLGRSFRALKMWWIIRAFGRRGLASRLAEHIRLARQLGAWIDAHPDFERVVPSPYPLVCFRAFPRSLRAATTGDQNERDRRRDALNAQLLERINADGRRFLSHTVTREGYLLRVSIGNIRTEERHVAALWDAVQRALRELEGLPQ